MSMAMRMRLYNGTGVRLSRSRRPRRRATPILQRRMSSSAGTSLPDPPEYGPPRHSAWMDVDWPAHRSFVEIGGDRGDGGGIGPGGARGGVGPRGPGPGAERAGENPPLPAGRPPRRAVLPPPPRGPGGPPPEGLL